jgi:hypothetical protein
MDARVEEIEEKEKLCLHRMIKTWPSDNWR